jgi:adenylate kinase family enzyme
MEVYTLIGESGTGKSSNAISFANEHHIQAIIDDGLFIYQGEKLAGSSAKFEKTMIAAVKRAIFHDDEHAQTVKNVLKEMAIERILVIGTSKKMVQKIVDRLDIGPIHHYYYIEDILTPDQIAKAKHERMTKGKHVIPVSYKQFDQNLIRKLIQKGIEIFTPQKEKMGEITVVRPFFHRRLLMRIKQERVKLQEKQLKMHEEGLATNRRTFIYVSTKEEFIKLITVIGNFIEEQLMLLKEKLSHYYDYLSQAIRDEILHFLANLRYLLRYLMEKLESSFVF